MPSIILIDTSIFLNVLNIPAFNQHREEIVAELTRLFSDSGINLLLPVAAIIETGNHIAQLSDGRNRRRFASVFSDQVRAAIRGDAPWRAMQVPEIEVIATWLDEFPDHAMRGVGMGDLSIIKEWSAVKDRHPGYEVTIWTLDNSMSGFAETHAFHKNDN